MAAPSYPLGVSAPPIPTVPERLFFSFRAPDDTEASHDDVAARESANRKHRSAYQRAKFVLDP